MKRDSIEVRDRLEDALALLIVLRDAVSNRQLHPSVEGYYVLINIIEDKLRALARSDE